MTNDDTIYRVPVQEKNGYCPECSAKIHSRWGRNFCMHSTSGTLVKRFLSLPWCDACRSFSCDGTNAFYPEAGLYLEMFRIKDPGRADFGKIYDMEHKRPEKSLVAEDFSLCIQKGYPEIDEPKAYYIVQLPKEKQHCPACNSNLKNHGAVILPVNDANFMIVRGRICRQCDTVFVSDPSLIRNLVNPPGRVLVHIAYKTQSVKFYIYFEDLGDFLRPTRKGDTNVAQQWKEEMKIISDIATRAESINGRKGYLELIERWARKSGNPNKLIKSRVLYPSNKYDKWQKEKGGYRNPGKLISQQPERKVHQPYVAPKTTTMIVTLRVNINNDEKLYFITGNQAIVNDDTNVYHYTSKTARELLTAAFRPERELKGRMDGNLFTVTDVYTADDEKKNSILTDTVYIKRDGGYRTSYANDKQREAMSVLLYSPITDRYELLAATYDKDSSLTFTDMQLVTFFVETYGNPGINFYAFSNSRGDSFGTYDNLNDTSELMELGYTVRADSILSKADREELLSFIIDLKILTVSKIASLLKFFIDSHPSERYDEARRKWSSDRQFVQSYKFNPSRFVIAQNIKRQK